jgi:hypothetical protein
MDEDSPAIRRDSQRNTGSGPTSPTPRWLRCANVSIVSTSDRKPALHLRDASRSEIAATDIRQQGERSDGVVLENSVDCLINGGTIRSTRYPVYVRTTGQPASRAGDCLLTLSDRVRLETTSDDTDALRSEDATSTTVQWGGLLNRSYCLVGETLDSFQEAGTRGRSIAITGDGGGSLLISAVEDPD